MESNISGSALVIVDGVQLTTVGQMLSYLLVSSLDGSTKTQPVDSNIWCVNYEFPSLKTIIDYDDDVMGRQSFTLRSKGSPLRFPSMIVNEWQVAIPISNMGGSSLFWRVVDGLRSFGGRRADKAWDNFSGAAILRNELTTCSMSISIKLYFSMEVDNGDRRQLERHPTNLNHLLSKFQFYRSKYNSTILFEMQWKWRQH